MKSCSSGKLKKSLTVRTEHDDRQRTSTLVWWHKFIDRERERQDEIMKERTK